MGIYLPNMEMPRKGQMLVIFPDGTSYVCFNGMRERLTQTTVVPVPPHGRLIDADFIVKRLKKQIDDVGKDTELANRDREFISVIGAVSTIIPAEEGE